MKRWVLLLSILCAASAEAANLVVPTGRPLVLMSDGAEPASVTITFYGPDDDRTVETIGLTGSATVDVPAGTAMIRITSPRPVTARAALLPAIDVDALATEHVLSGSIGVANPWKAPASLVVTVNEQQLFRIVPPLGVLQLDTGGASARITSQIGVYAYDGHSSVGEVAQTTSAPQCAEPAALMAAPPGQPPGGGWIVIGDAEPYFAELTPAQLAELRCDRSVQLIARAVIAPSQP